MTIKGIAAVAVPAQKKKKGAKGAWCDDSNGTGVKDNSCCTNITCKGSSQTLDIAIENTISYPYPSYFIRETTSHKGSYKAVVCRKLWVGHEK